MDKAGQAFELMAAQRMNCAQTVLSVYCEELRLDRDTALRLAQGFGGGIGRTGMVCGAVTGSCMVLGLSQKIPPDKPRAGMEKTVELIREFNRRFKELRGSLICKDLIEFDLNSPEGLAAAREKKVFTAVCPYIVTDAVKILEELVHP